MVREVARRGRRCFRCRSSAPNCHRQRRRFLCRRGSARYYLLCLASFLVCSRCYQYPTALVAVSLSLSSLNNHNAFVSGSPLYLLGIVDDMFVVVGSHPVLSKSYLLLEDVPPMISLFSTRCLISPFGGTYVLRNLLQHREPTLAV